MLLLATDTSGRQGSIGLARGNHGTCELIESVRLDGGAFSAQLVPQIALLLSDRGFSKNDIGGFVAVCGPGSFTGLRVGLAAIKALAVVLRKPIAAVSLLEVVAISGRRETTVIAAIEAGRQQIYVGEYEVAAGNARRIDERLVSRSELASVVHGHCVVTSSSDLALLARSLGAEVQLISAPTLDEIAWLGWRKILAGETVSPEDLEANYISRPNAEVLRDSTA